MPVLCVYTWVVHIGLSPPEMSIGRGNPEMYLLSDLATTAIPQADIRIISEASISHKNVGQSDTEWNVY